MSVISSCYFIPPCKDTSVSFVICKRFISCFVAECEQQDHMHLHTTARIAY